MESFIAYFDYLGFEKFVDNNSSEEQQSIFNAVIFSDIETSLSQGKIKETSFGIEQDISDCKIHCMNFSDTVIFWTSDTFISSLKELLRVARMFNFRSLYDSFPVRGAIVCGDIIHYDYREVTKYNAQYNINSLIGKGIVNAHRKAESQNWAGTVIDSSVINKLYENNIELEQFFKPFAVKYEVPYKNLQEKTSQEFVLTLSDGISNHSGTQNLAESVRGNFSKYKKSVDTPDIINKISNTLKFIKSEN